MGTKNVHLHYCQIADEHCPLAITRFTSFDLDDKPLAVEQVMQPFKLMNWCCRQDADFNVAR